MKEENEAIIKALNMYGRVPEQWELLNEIERLNNIINGLEKHCETMLSIFGQMTDEQRQEQLDRYKIYDGFLRRLQELKGSDKE